VTTDSIDEQVHAILRRRNPHVALLPDLPLGGDGVGLDSISLVEVLLECEETFAIQIAAELVEQNALTVGLLIERVRTAGQTS
jgi:acyl carrier protein